MRLKPTLDSTDALTLRRAAIDAAERAGLAACIAVVDGAGVTLEIYRSDLAKAHTVDLATRKARTAALLGLPTQVLEQMAAQGRPMTPEVLALAGGVPILVDGVSAGGVGVSGGTSELDHQIAVEAVKALTP